MEAIVPCQKSCHVKSARALFWQQARIVALSRRQLASFFLAVVRGGARADGDDYLTLLTIDINLLPTLSLGRLGHLWFFPTEQISSTMWGGMAGSGQQAGHYGPAGGGGKFCALARLASRNF